MARREACRGGRFALYANLVRWRSFEGHEVSATSFRFVSVCALADNVFLGQLGAIETMPYCAVLLVVFDFLPGAVHATFLFRSR